MDLRRRSIRLKILLLVLVPLLSLIGLYAFVAGITIGDATKAASTPSLRNEAGEPVLQFLQQVETERRLAGLYVATPTPQLRAALNAQAAKTDKFRTAMNAGLMSSTTSGSASKNQKDAIAALLRDGPGLGAIRSKVTGGGISPLEAINGYNNLTTDIHLFMTRLAQRVSPEVQLQAYSLFQSIASIEMLAREDAIIEADAAAGSLPDPDRNQFIELVSLRRQYAEDAERNIGRHVLPSYARYVSPQASATLTSLENSIMDDSRPGGPVPVDPAAWGKSVVAMSKGNGALVQAMAVDVSGQGSAAANSAYLRLGLAGGLGLIALAASVFISIRVGRRLVRQLAALRDSALALATERLPQVMARLRSGEDVDVSEESPSMAVTPDEIGQVGQAFNTVQLTAVEAAVDQARLRRGISDVFRNLARRSQSLLHRQLSLLDTMERRTSDPDELADLYRLDHLTTRMRRHAEGLIILSGAPVGRSWRNPVRLVDVMRAAVAEVEDYTRVTVATMTEAALAGQAVADVIHMIAELVENATLFSPPNTPVRLAGDVVGNGFAVEIEDRGLGMSEERLAELNHRLANPPEFDLSDSDQLGLFVAGRLAQRHGVRISMQNNAYGGSTAIVLMPHSLVVPGDIDLETAFANSGDGGSGRHADGGEALATSNGRTPRPNPESPIGNGTAGKEGARRPSPGVGLDARPNAGGLLDTPLSAAEDPLVGTVPDGTSDSVGRPDFSTSTAQSHDIDWRPPDVSPPPAAGIGTPGLGLPRRIRQANLAPQLRTNAPPPSHAGAEQEAVGDRSPEQTRALMSSLQRGWERGRSAPEIGLGHSESSGYQDGAPTEGENGGR